MPITTLHRVSGPYAGTGTSTGPFTFNYKVFKPSDVDVVVRDATGTETTTPVGDYVVTLYPDQEATPGGTVTLDMPLAVGLELYIVSDIPETQEVNWINQGRYRPDLLNLAFDKVTALIQQLHGWLYGLDQRALKVPPGETVTDVPGMPERAQGVLGFDSEGNPVIYNPGDIGGASAVIQYREVIAADGQTTFQTNAAYVVGFVSVFVNGVRLSIQEFSAPGGNAVTLFEPCFAGDVVLLESFLGADTPTYESVAQRKEIVATAGQTIFQTTMNYTVGYLGVYVNGVRLAEPDYTATDGVNVVLTQPCHAGDFVLLEGFLGSGTAGRAHDRVSVKDFGARSDGSDSHAAIQAAASYACSAGLALYFPGGTYICNGDIATTGTLAITGDGSDVSQLRFTGGTNHGWISTLSGADDIVIVERITFETTGTTGTGLDITYTLTGFDNRDGRRVYTDDLCMRGATEDGGWTQQVWLHNINGSRHDFFWGTGKNHGSDDGSEAANTQSLYSFRIDGSEWPTDHQFMNPTWYSFNTCVIGGGKVEGVTIADFIAVLVGRLISWTPELGAGGRPGCKITGGHCNAYFGVGVFNGIQQGQITDNELYHNQDATNSFWQGWSLTNCEDWSFRGNSYYRYLAAAATPTSEGIVIVGAQTGGILIDGEDFGGKYTRLDRGINIGSDVLAGKVMIGPTNKFNGNYRIADITAPTAQLFIGKPQLAVRRSTAFSVPNSVDTLIPWDLTDHDPFGLWTNGATAFTVPVGRGIRFAKISIGANWDAGAVGMRQISIKRNGSLATYVAPSNVNAVTVAGIGNGQSINAIVPVVGGDTLAMGAFHNQGAALNVQPGLTSMSIEFL